MVVIGRQGKDVSESQALDLVLGYAAGNDVSHRHLQLERGGGQWSLGKGFDRWAPFGPGIVTKELIPDPQALELGTRVNKVQKQKGHTSNMIFSVAKAVSYLSQGTTLMPGDLIFMGT